MEEIRSDLGSAEAAEEHIRQLRERMQISSGEQFDDRELLTLLMSFAGKPEHAETVADALIAAFRDFRTVFKADYFTLGRIPEITDRDKGLLLLLGHIIKSDRPDAGIRYGERFDDIGALFAREIDGSPNEELWAMGFDEHGVLCALECIARGDLDNILANVSDITSFCVRKHVHSVALAHNHPIPGSGGISEADRKNAEMLWQILHAFDISLCWFVLIDDKPSTICFETPRSDIRRKEK